MEVCCVEFRSAERNSEINFDAGVSVWLPGNGIKKKKKISQAEPARLIGKRYIYIYINEGDKGSQGLRLWGRKSSSRIKRCARSIRQSINPEDREKFERANGRGKSHDCCMHLDTRHFDPNQSIQILKILNSFLEYICYIRNRSIRTHQWINSP